MPEPPSLRLLFVVHGLPMEDASGGVEIFTFSLAKELARQGNVVQFFCPKLNGKHPPLINGISVCFSPDRRSESPLLNLTDPAVETAFKNAVIKFKPDLVHIHHLKGLSAGIMSVCRGLHLPYIITLQDFWTFCDHIHLYPGAGVRACENSEDGRKCANCFLHIHFRGLTSRRRELHLASDFIRLRRRFILDGLLAAECLIVPSEFVRQRFLVEWKNLRSKMILVRDGVVPVSAVARRHRHPPVLGFFGGVSEVKGLYVLLNALEGLPRPPELRIYSADRSKILKWLRTEEYGPFLRRFLRVCGKFHRRQLSRILSELDVVVIPSFVETFSLVAAEALTAGKPVIASRAGALGELISDRVNGFLFSPGNSTELANLIGQCVADPRFLNRLGVPGFVRTIREVASDMLQIYTKTVKREKTIYRFMGKRQLHGIKNASGNFKHLQTVYQTMRQAEILRSQGHLNEAINLYRRILQKDSSHIIAGYRLANCYLETGNLILAEIAYRTVLGSVSRLPVRISTEAYEASSAFYLAQIRLRRKDVGESIRWLRHCLKIIPYHHRARMLYEDLRRSNPRSKSKQVTSGAVSLTPSSIL